MSAEAFYVLRWKRNAPPVDYSICDAYDGHELYVTSDQADAFAERLRLGKVRPVKRFAILYGRTFQALFAGPKRSRCVGWRMMRRLRVHTKEVSQ